MMYNEVFFSLDIETDGPVPLKNSMLSFALVAFLGDGTVIGKFERNLLPLPGATQDKKTMEEFWAKEPEAWAACHENRVEHEVAMKEYAHWVHSIPAERKICLCAPVGFDYTFMYMYSTLGGKMDPFRFNTLDIKSYLGKTPFHEGTRAKWESKYREASLPHTHKAIDDAVEQGLAFLLMKAERENFATTGLHMIYMNSVRKKFLDTWKAL